MGQFAFLIHPLDINVISIAFNEANLKNKNIELLKKAFEWMPTFKCSEVIGLKSKTGKTANGYLIYCALLPEQIISLDQKFVLNKIIDGGIAAEKLGAKIIGLGAYAAQVGKKGILVANSLSIPVTTGTHYTVAVAIEGTLSAAKKIGVKLEEAKISVIGATGSIGKICAQIFAEIAGELILVARNQNILEAFASSLKDKSKAKISISNNLLLAIKQSDISIMCTTTPEALVDMDDLEPGTIICDVSRPRNVSMKRGIFREDVLVIDGGVIRPPGNVHFNFYLGLSEGLGYACMAETMILALEERYENYSLGGHISLEKVKEISYLSKKHGFRLSEIRSFDTIIQPEIIQKVKKCYSNKKKM